MNNTYHRAKKSLGQNFLVDQNICRRIVHSARIKEDSRVLEIGPGQGALTRHLLETGCDLTVVEKDRDLAERLENDHPELTVLQADALRFSWEDFGSKGACTIVGNLPYNIGSKLIWDIVARTPNLERAVFMVQHEVALRLTAEQGTKAFGGLTVWVRNHAGTRYLFKVPPTVFRPQPKVDSAVVEFLPLPAEKRPENPEALSKLIRLLFQKRRKQLSTILKKQWTEQVREWFDREGVAPSARPETLSPEQFERLSRCI